MGEAVVVSEEPLKEAGRRIAEAILASDVSRGGTRFAIAGGSAAQALQYALPALPDDVWKRVSLTWVDERRVPFASPDSNRGEAYRKGWLSKDRPPGFELPLWLDDDTPEKAIRRVKRALEDNFKSKIDVTLLGLGEDGHIASLFPGHPARFVKGPVTTLDDSPKPPAQRITLTYEILRTSRAQVLVASGEGKRAALERIVSGDTLAPVNALPEITLVTNLKLGGQS
jgi:6-phosphogluconolactonase